MNSKIETPARHANDWHFTSVRIGIFERFKLWLYAKIDKKVEVPKELLDVREQPRLYRTIWIDEGSTINKQFWGDKNFVTCFIAPQDFHLMHMGKTKVFEEIQKELFIEELKRAHELSSDKTKELAEKVKKLTEQK